MAQEKDRDTRQYETSSEGRGGDTSDRREGQFGRGEERRPTYGAFYISATRRVQAHRPGTGTAGTRWSSRGAESRDYAQAGREEFDQYGGREEGGWTRHFGERYPEMGREGGRYEGDWRRDAARRQSPMRGRAEEGRFEDEDVSFPGRDFGGEERSRWDYGRGEARQGREYGRGGRGMFEQRGFGRERRWRREPLTAREIMTRDVKTVTRDTPLQDVARIMKDEDVGIVPVVDGDHRLLGVVTDRDIVVRTLAEGKNPMQLKAGDVMTDEIEGVTPDEELRDVIDLMGRKQVRRVPVVDKDDRLLGIISMGDIANRADYDEDLQDALEDISSKRSFWSRIWS